MDLKGVTMFDTTCTECRRHLLIFPSQITGMTNVDGGIRVAYSCWCGSEQTWVTGSSQRAPVAA